MSFNGSGTFVINSSGQPVVANTVISSTVFNALTADLATGLSTCITKDGQTTPTANIPMGTFKFTNLGNGSAATDSATLGQVQASTTKLVTVTGSDTIAGTMNPALTAYASGQMFYFIAAGANTGAVTLNIDGLGARNVTRDGSTALAANDILSGEVALVVYDGTRFQLLNPANAGSMTVSNLTVTGTTTLSGLTASTALALDASKNVVSVTNTGTGNNVLATSPTLTTPNLGTPSAIVLTNASGTASININGTVGASTPSTGAFTTLSATGNVSTANGLVFSAISSTPAGVFIHRPATDAIGFGHGGSEQMRLVSGNLGIGTATPGSYLSGTAKLVAYANANSQNSILVRNDSAGSSASCAIALNASGNVWGIECGSTAKNNNALTFQLDYGGTNSTKMTLDSSGNLGLGVTPSAWGASYKVLQLPSGAISADSTAVIEMRQNSLWSGSANVYVNNGFASNYYQYNGIHAWFTAPSGTAGNAISFTQAMTLDSSGNLGIGTASPASLLHLSTARATQTMVSTTGTNDVLFRQTNTGGNFSIGMDDSGGTNYGSAYCSALFHSGARAMLFGTNNTERMRITATGNIVAGASAALATTATDGFLYVPTCAGTPTGTPTAITGMAPIVVDTTNNKMYFYSGGQWRDAGP